MSSSLGLSDYEFYYGPAGGSGGLSFGIGTNIDAMKIDGLTDQNVITSDHQHQNEFGDVPGIFLAKSRLVTFDLDIRKGSLTEAQWRDLIDDVEGLFTVEYETQHELHWKFPSEEERFIRARMYKRKRLIDPDSELGISRIAVQLRLADPRYYKAAPSTDNTNTGTFTVTNNGRQRAYPRMLFNRSSGGSSVKVTNNTTGIVFEVVGLGGTTNLTADMDLLIRGETGLVVYRGSTNDYPFWQQPRIPFYLEPGGNNITLQAGNNISFTWWDTFV